MKGSDWQNQSTATGSRPETESELYRHSLSTDNKAKLLGSRPMAFVRAGTLGPADQNAAVEARSSPADGQSMYDRLYMPQNERLQKKFQEIEKG